MLRCLCPTGTATAAYDNGTKTLSITSAGGVILAVKLERGTISTLANDPPADYGEQLALCQQYYVRISGTGEPIGFGYVSGTTQARVKIPLPTKMRIVPTITVDDLSKLRLKANGANYTPTAITATYLHENGATAYLTISGGTDGYPVILRNESGAMVELSADL